MSRRIIETTLQASKTEAKVDNYLEKLMKYIPSEIVGAWIAIQGIFANGDREVEAVNSSQNIFLWVILAFLSILTFFYIKQQTYEESKKTAIKQIIVSVIAFLIWAYAIGGEPFLSLEFYDSRYGAVFMILYTVTIPLLVLNQD